jgi:hypothetical protein
MYNLQEFKKFFMDKYSTMSVKGEPNDFLDEALTAPNLYVCFEKVFDAINNVKDITDPITKAKFIELDDILLLFKGLNKKNSNDVELQRLLDNAISRFEYLTKGTELVITKPKVKILKPLYQIGSTSFVTKDAMNEYLLRRVSNDLEYLKTNANSSDKEIIIEMIKDINILKQ